MASTVPVVPLAYPTILLPGARITVPVSRGLGDQLLAIFESAESQPVVAAVPTLAPTDTHSSSAGLSQWATTARVTRLVRPPPRNPRHPFFVSLQGLSRIRLTTPSEAPLSADDYTHSLRMHAVEYLAKEQPPSHESVEVFKAAALRLLDRLAKDAVQQSRKEAWVKVAGMVEDIEQHRAPWMADVMVAAINGEYADKLAFLSSPDAETRIRLATELFIKQASISEVSKKIAASVDESLSKQQKEFFLRQQMAAIQRELINLNSRTAIKDHSDFLLPDASPHLNLKSDAAGAGARSELDDDDAHEADDLAELKGKIEAMERGSEERKMGVREWRRLKRIQQGSVENGVIRTYLEWLTAVPWPSAETDGEAVRDPAFLANARKQLDADHFGLEKIKRRLIEYLAVVRLKQMNAEAEAAAGVSALVPVPAPSQSPSTHTPPTSTPKRRGVKGPILLFVGPPGTGKTSLGLSVAKALNRPFQRISLGGVRDEAEIRGHRRTYVASGPGAIVQALRKAGRLDPVILLDEVDKVGQSNFHGDPGAALLEVLDPEQNHSFMDHYINVPIDLSQVLFICTSNTLDTISAPLLDRCEIIQLSGYTYDEKMHIARNFLLPKQLTANGLTPSHVTLTPPALLTIATQYTSEAGVRSLERAIGAVVRHKAVSWAEHADAGSDAKAWDPLVHEAELEGILGIARWDGEERDREERRGLAYGLVVSGVGEGGVLPVESMIVPGSGRLKLTGSLGDVIKESGEIALTWVKTHAYDLCITHSRAHDVLKVPEPIDIHLHLPAGATKKDGPSAGVAMTCAFVSLLTGVCIPKDIAMTGEITLRGRVTPVGGIKEKVLGAHRAQIKKVILPWANRKDVEHDVAPEIRKDMQFVFVRTVEEALEAVFGKGRLGWRNNPMLVESRL